MKKTSIIVVALLSVTVGRAQNVFDFGSKRNPQGVTFEVDSRGFVVGGKHVLPVMGEIHYSRVPEQEWRREICKMRAGGIGIVATYCFWNHHEPEEGRWNWSGNCNLHRFLEICKEEGMPVVLRIGPFCHGEVYQGGFPDWLLDKVGRDAKQYKLRSVAPGFMAATQRLYSNIFAQASDMLWKHGGPVVGVQIENECRGPWNYYMALKDMAVSVGFDVPFYTRTGWPKLSGNEEFGKLLPLYGDYADGFWDRQLDDMPGNYAKAFVFKDTRLSDVIATEALGSHQDTRMEASDLKYPYLTCELGGGMMTSYHRRINMNGNENFPLAICKVGSGSNLPGYYMYHGGTNPQGDKHGMAEMQNSRTTAHNDLPYMTYDFQAPLGEMGQPCEEAFHQTRWFHQMLSDWGEELSQYDVDSLSDHYARRGCFVFRNDYVRIAHEEGGASVTPEGMRWEGLKLSSTTLQPFAMADGMLYFIMVKGAKRCQLTVDGKKYTLVPDVPKTIEGRQFVVLSSAKARTAFVVGGTMQYAQHGGILYTSGGKLYEEYWQPSTLSVSSHLTQEAGPLRTVGMGAAKVAEQPDESHFRQAAVYTLTLDSEAAANADNLFLRIDYKGDVARLYADGRLVEDNFWNGKPMLVRVSDLIGKRVELKILPLDAKAPIYFQQAQRDIVSQAPATGLLTLSGISFLERVTVSR